MCAISIRKFIFLFNIFSVEYYLLNHRIRKYEHIKKTITNQKYLYINLLREWREKLANTTLLCVVQALKQRTNKIKIVPDCFSEGNHLDFSFLHMNGAIQLSSWRILKVLRQNSTTDNFHSNEITKQLHDLRRKYF